jgi:exodeoxyribonuclease VII large subunit
MDELSANKQAYRLSELNGLIKSVLSETLPGAYWVVAETAECKLNQRGHCYMELVEKEDNKVVAQIKATIWAYDYRRIGQKFKNATGESLKPGMKLLLQVSVNFHEVYGLSLTVRDIDPTYTMGEMARKKKEVIGRLMREGLLDMNRALPLPLVPQRIAVISSPTAAGYGDFFDQLDGNPYGYKFAHLLFPALMQGQEAETSVIAALDKIMKKKHFDAVVIIRGGGSAVDLSCFDGYPLAARIARFPLPVLTGIGHEKDDTVADMVSHTSMKTPTAVAEFLISGARGFEEQLLAIQNRIHLRAERLMKEELYRLNSLAQRLTFIPSRIYTAAQHRLLLLEGDLRSRTQQLLQQQEAKLGSMEQAVRLLDPVNVLKRGYSITRSGGSVVKDAYLLRVGQRIETRLYNGTVTGIVASVAPERKQRAADKTTEDDKSEQKQTDNLFSGLDRA